MSSPGMSSGPGACCACTGRVPAVPALVVYGIQFKASAAGTGCCDGPIASKNERTWPNGVLEKQQLQ
jgi:hypothetical protein